MVEWFNNWIQGIIIAVIIATIIEMILPHGTIKKYIKVVIGMYILFAIISPLIEKVTHIDTEKILDTSSYAKEIEDTDNKINKKIESDNSKTIKDIYLNNVENDIKTKLKQKGYNVKNILANAEGKDNYEISKISLSLEKIDNNKQNTYQSNDIDIQINEVILSSNKQADDNSPKNKLKDSDKENIKNYLSELYGVSINNISIE